MDASNPAIRSGLVQVIARDNDGDARLTGSGFIIGNAGHVLTAMHLVDGEERIEILPLAAPGNPLDGRVIFSNPRADLALLSVAGLPADGLPLALDGFDPGRLVFSAGVWRAGDETWELDATIDDRPADLGNGTVGELSEIAAASGAPAVPLLSHNAMIPAAGYGGPLLNRCNEVVGVNRGTPGVSVARLRRGEAPEDAVTAVGITAVVGLMNRAGIEVSREEDSCPSVGEAALELVEEAEARAEAARAEAAARVEEAEAQAAARVEEVQTEAESRLEEVRAEAEERVAAAEAQALEIREQLEQETSRAQEAQDLVSDLESQYEEAVSSGAAEAESLLSELEAARADRDGILEVTAALESQLANLQTEAAEQQQADQMRLYAVAGGAAAVLVTLLAVFLIYSHRRTRELALATGSAAEAQREASRAREQAQAAASSAARDALTPDCLLNGQTEDGRPVALKIPGSMLLDNGSIIGRNPRNSTFLIDDRTLSREHARLFWDSDNLMIENLGATNGVVINGRDLRDNDTSALRGGDEIELGGVKLRVELRAADVG